MVSVLIPFRNAAPWIRECIHSIQKQTLTNWEVIWMNDHSEDESEAILQSESDSRFRVVRVQGRGIVAALQEGLALCQYPFIARMDADDIMPPDRLKQQVEYLMSHPAVGLVSGQVSVISHLEDGRGYQRYVDWINNLIHQDNIYRYRFVESPLAHPSVMFRADLPLRFGGYREGDFPEDYELWLRWLEAGVQMEKVAENVLCWRDHPVRLSRGEGRYSPEAFQSVRAVYLARWLRSIGRTGVWYWGDGRVARAQRKWLGQEGIVAEGVVEVDPGRKKSGVIHYTHLGPPQGRFLVSLVGNTGARQQIEAFLIQNGWLPEQDFILAG